MTISKYCIIKFMGNLVIKEYLGVDFEKYCKDKKINAHDLLERERAFEDIRISIIKKHVENGVIFESIVGIYIDDTVEIREGAYIYPNNRLKGKTFIGANCKLREDNTIVNSIIRSGVRIEKSEVRDSEIGQETTVGPFANIHTNSLIGAHCRIGNFVEIKNSVIGKHTKMAHLAYIGDADIGNQCNIGCGVVFVNYDGKNKHRSKVGDSAFIGSNSNIVAPAIIEDNAFIAAATTVTKPIPANSMCIGRAREEIKLDRSKYHKNIFNKKHFGTDGIRGKYRKDITDEIAYLCGNYIGYSSDFGKVILGRDTRVSGEAIEDEIVRGIIDSGATVVDMGVVATPVVAYSTISEKANYGIVISASHNPSEDNGIKIFNSQGEKLQDIDESEIENHISRAKPIIRERKGKKIIDDNLQDTYFNHLKECCRPINGKKLKIVIDCANGAVSKYAKKYFEELGHEVVSLNDEGNGEIINNGTGALYPEVCAKRVVEEKANLGFSFDGDADRIIAINEKGTIVDGDGIIYVLSQYLKKKNQLNGDKVVCTIYTNLGVEEALRKKGVEVVRSDVGDHNVSLTMQQNDIVLGGEQAGHIIMNQFLPTGDALFVALFLSKILSESGTELSSLYKVKPYYQVQKGFVTERKNEVMEDEEFKTLIMEYEAKMKDKGRIIVRKSGTEPKVRLMIECKNKALADTIMEGLYNYLENKYKEGEVK